MGPNTPTGFRSKADGEARSERWKAPPRRRTPLTSGTRQCHHHNTHAPASIHQQMACWREPQHIESLTHRIQHIRAQAGRVHCADLLLHSRTARPGLLSDSACSLPAAVRSKFKHATTAALSTLCCTATGQHRSRSRGRNRSQHVDYGMQHDEGDTPPLPPLQERDSHRSRQSESAALATTGHFMASRLTLKHCSSPVG